MAGRIERLALSTVTYSRITPLSLFFSFSLSLSTFFHPFARDCLDRTQSDRQDELAIVSRLGLAIPEAHFAVLTLAIEAGRDNLRPYGYEYFCFPITIIFGVFLLSFSCLSARHNSTSCNYTQTADRAACHPRPTRVRRLLCHCSYPWF